MLDNNNNDNNRQCEQSCCNHTPTSSIPTYSYNFTTVDSEQTCPHTEMTRQEVLNQIQSLDFSVVELAQYLDTHENDEKALLLHKEYSTRLESMKEKYQKIYGPLSIYYPCNKWRWLEEPWPWERGNF